jgi:hypothetical protein
MRSQVVATLGLAALGLALAACTDDNGDPGDNGGTQPTTTGPTATLDTGADGTGEAADCVVGDWRSTGVAGEIGGDVADVAVSGASGVTLTVGPDGAATIDFTDMEPASFGGEVAGTDVAGELSYAGQATGTIRAEADDPQAASGSWEPVDTADWSDARVTVDLTEPVAARPFDDTPVGDVVGQADQTTGEVVDVEPILGAGTFECQGQDTLVLSPGHDRRGMTWMLERA